MKEALRNAGGANGIRGYLVQTLIGLLEILKAKPAFTQITFEPDHSNEQFDYIWSDGTKSYAVQVKSSINPFTSVQVKSWIKKMKTAHSADTYTLSLVGSYGTHLNLSDLDGVCVKHHVLDIPALIDQSSHVLSLFLDKNNINNTNAIDREQTVYTLLGKLTHIATKSETFKHDDLLSLLKQWIRSVPKQTATDVAIEITNTSPVNLIGREEEIQRINNAWEQAVSSQERRPHILTVVGLGGEGKTSLVAKWLADMSYKQWPECTAVLGWSFYDQGASGVAASSDLFLNKALLFFGDPETVNGSQTSYEKGLRLAELSSRPGTIIILDGLETLQYPPTSVEAGKLLDTGMSAFLNSLAVYNKGLCIITSRYKNNSLQNYWNTTCPQVELMPLTQEASLALLSENKVHGLHEDLLRLAIKFKGHALSLILVSSFLVEAHGGNAKYFDEINLSNANVEHGGHAFRVLDSYVWWLEQDKKYGKKALSILRLLAFFDRPAKSEHLSLLLAKPNIVGLTNQTIHIENIERNRLLHRLQLARLISVKFESDAELVMVDTHPIIRKYFAEELQTKRAAGWREGHRRLYTHLCTTTKEGDSPSLLDLQPLYQAIYHGCAAGLQNQAYREVLRNRIHRNGEFYSQNILGAYSSDLDAMACFFDEPWALLSSNLGESEQRFILNNTGFLFAQTGRLKEAQGIFEMSLLDFLIVKEITQTTIPASISLSNLSNVELRLGELEKAKLSAELAVKNADWGGRPFDGTSKRTRLANALFKLGDIRNAENIFIEAESIQRSNGGLEYLSSEGHYLYGDLLLHEVFRECWLIILELNIKNNYSQLCKQIVGRCKTVLGYSANLVQKVDIAFEYVLAARAMTYSSIIGDSMIDEADVYTSKAFILLKNYGNMSLLVDALLDRSMLNWLKSGRKANANSRRDLDEAMRIAEAASMKLSIADIHLYRARLFFNVDFYPWKTATEDIVLSEEIIRTHGYGCRTGELQDAQGAILKGN